MRNKKEREEVLKHRETLQTKNIEFTEEHKKSIKDIYDTIIPVKFRWGGTGFIKVRNYLYGLLEEKFH